MLTQLRLYGKYLGAMDTGDNDKNLRAVDEAGYALEPSDN
jgi:hypothetical protein